MGQGAGFLHQKLTEVDLHGPGIAEDGGVGGPVIDLVDPVESKPLDHGPDDGLAPVNLFQTDPAESLDLLGSGILGFDLTGLIGGRFGFDGFRREGGQTVQILPDLLLGGRDPDLILGHAAVGGRKRISSRKQRRDQEDRQGRLPLLPIGDEQAGADAEAAEQQAEIGQPGRQHKQGGLRNRGDQRDLQIPPFGSAGKGLFV